MANIALHHQKYPSYYMSGVVMLRKYQERCKQSPNALLHSLSYRTHTVHHLMYTGRTHPDCLAVWANVSWCPVG